jgi:hypothetical protein
MSSIANNHPKQKLVFLAVDDIDATMRDHLRTFVNGLTTSREWTLGPRIS